MPAIPTNDSVRPTQLIRGESFPQDFYLHATEVVATRLIIGTGFAMIAQLRRVRT